MENKKLEPCTEYEKDLYSKMLRRREIWGEKQGLWYCSFPFFVGVGLISFVLLSIFDATLEWAFWAFGMVGLSRWMTKRGEKEDERFWKLHERRWSD